MSETFDDRLTQLNIRMKENAIKNGRQKYPSSIIKVGAVLYSVDAFSYDDGTSEISITEWVVRSIARKRGTQTAFGQKRVGYGCGDSAPAYVNLTAKIKNVTWCRMSKKVNDFGWSKSIPSSFRKQFRVGDYLPLGVFTTIPASIRHAIKQKKKRIESSILHRNQESEPREIEEWNEDILVEEKELRLLKTRLTKISNSAKKK